MINAVSPLDSDRPGLYALWQEAFGDAEVDIDRFFSTAYAPQRCLCVKIDREIAAVAYWLDCSYCGGKLAYIYAVATAKAHRGRGLCHQLLEQIHTLLKEQGYAGAILVPGDAGLSRLYGGMGYQFCSGMDTLQCQAQAPVPLRAISAEEYAQLRRTYLPEGGVVQEDENLHYLGMLARFYAGADFLLAAAVMSSTLVGLELLGNCEKIGGITAALGCDTGSFRTPGKNNFAMWYPLGDFPAPCYLGFAFD